MSEGRHELKYWAQANAVTALLAELAPLLEPDEHQGAARSYSVTSLYFDTRDLRFYWEKVEGLKKRCKLRLRHYGEPSAGFIEAKRKRGDRIEKQRVHLSSEELAAMARGDFSGLPNHRGDAADALSALTARHRLEPVVLIRYERRAWQLIEDPRSRLTIDEGLTCLGHDLPAAFLASASSGPRLHSPTLSAPLIVEVKVSGPIPGVMRQALRRQGLVRTSISKYCICLSHERALGYG